MAKKQTKYSPQKQKNPALRNFEKAVKLKKQKEDALIELKEAEVYQHYSDFQRFMRWENAPKFIIEPVLINEYHAQTKMPETIGDPFIIELSPEVVRRQTDSYPAVLFHEFTHIFDDATIHEDAVQRGISRPTTWFTEAHATEVELMFLCGFSNATERKRIPFNTSIHFCNEEMCLEEFGEQKKVEYQNHLSRAKQHLLDGNHFEIANEYAQAIKRVQYYLGFLRFCKLHCEMDIDTWSRIIRTDFFVTELGTNILKIKNIILKKNICADDFANLYTYDIDMFKTWRKRNTK